MNGREDAPILEFDPAPTAVIEPSEHIEPIESRRTPSSASSRT